MVKPSEKRLYLTRHGQALHNVANDWSIPDPGLTQKGREEAATLHEETKGTIQKDAELLVSSAMKRPLQTTVLGYPDLRKRLEAEGKRVIILPQLQESAAYPCDIGSTREELEANPEFSGLDFGELTPDWTSKKDFYSAEDSALKARATWVRKWLRGRPESKIVVVAHAGILKYITDGYNSGKFWANAEVRVYTFASDEEDEDAEIVLV